MVVMAVRRARPASWDVVDAKAVSQKRKAPEPRRHDPGIMGRQETGSRDDWLCTVTPNSIPIPSFLKDKTALHSALCTLSNNDILLTQHYPNDPRCSL